MNLRSDWVAEKDPVLKQTTHLGRNAIITIFWLLLQ